MNTELGVQFDSLAEGSEDQDDEDDDYSEADTTTATSTTEATSYTITKSSKHMSMQMTYFVYNKYITTPI